MDLFPEIENEIDNARIEEDAAWKIVEPHVSVGHDRPTCRHHRSAVLSDLSAARMVMTLILAVQMRASRDARTGAEFRLSAGVGLLNKAGCYRDPNDALDLAGGIRP